MAAFFNIRETKINSVYVDGVKIHKDVYLTYHDIVDGVLVYTLEIKED